VTGRDGLKQQYLKDDKLEKGTDIPMGSLMLYEEGEWRARTLYARRVFMANIARGYFLTWFFLLPFSVVMLFLNDWLDPPQFWGFILLVLVITSAVFGPIAYVIHRNGKAEPVAGLYTQGLLLFNRIFVPYDQIESFEEKVAGNALFGRITLVHLLPKETGGKSKLLPLLAVPKGFLGQEGMLALYRAIEVPHQDDGPPTLVVYRGKGGVAKREYVPGEGHA
jgi:hypothetical protein